MAKKAVLIGCNYPGTKAELKGCINDVRRMHTCLINRYGFSDDDITVLIDTDDSTKQPTGHNIRAALSDLVGSARPGDFLFVHYSGHGTRLPAETGEQDDTGYDECIVPTDMNLITDDDFRDLVDKVPSGCQITIVSDSCHSGGLIDESRGLAQQFLQQKLENDESYAQPALATPVGSKQEAYAGASKKGLADTSILISGCQTHQTSADATPSGDATKSFGALSNAIQTILAESNGTVSNQELVSVTPIAIALVVAGFKNKNPLL
ncbi:hypothetical protein SASPL_155977 [Salvia splendens]|uniref:Peptidase C14 caspase domain-containing protein n=1 Tax=Salvia splendens TaxID=180675 RepID=A0A8X8VXJ6_SALSN|nr:hypothetical protein SASPL_155977 [Salvia splendens]